MSIVSRCASCAEWAAVLTPDEAAGPCRACARSLTETIWRVLGAVALALMLAWGVRR